MRPVVANLAANFEQIRSIVDQLSAAGSPVSDSELVHLILRGLGSEFNSLTTRSDPASLTDLHGFLLSHEALLTSQTQSHNFSSDPIALYTAQGNRERGRGRRGNGRGSGQSGRGSAPDILQLQDVALRAEEAQKGLQQINYLIHAEGNPAHFNLNSQWLVGPSVRSTTKEVMRP